MEKQVLFKEQAENVSFYLSTHETIQADIWMFINSGDQDLSMV